MTDGISIGFTAILAMLLGICLGYMIGYYDGYHAGAIIYVGGT